jgi:hypothetical protein
MHGDAGVGKTSLIGTAGQDFRVLIMRPPTDHTDPIVGSGCNEVIVRDWEDTWEVLEQVKHEGKNICDIFAIDSISLLQDVGLDDVYSGVLDAKGPPGDPARKYRERFGPDKGEYRVNMWRLEQFIRYMVGAADFHIIVTAHSFWRTEDDGTEKLWPWIQGKNMPNKIAGMMNLVTYMEVREREIRGEKRESRILHTNASPSWIAKCQFKDKPGGKSVFADNGHKIVNPTIPGIMETIGKGRFVSEEDELAARRVARRGSGRERPTTTRPATRRRTRREQ